MASALRLYNFTKSLVECVFPLSSTPSLRAVSTKLDRITIADFGTQIGLGRAQVKELLRRWSPITRTCRDLPLDVSADRRRCDPPRSAMAIAL
jgi:hypothetical protein